MKTSFARAMDTARRMVERGHADKAIELCQRILAQTDDGREAAIVQLGQAYHAAGRHADAAGAFRRALTIRPDWAAAHGLLGNALTAMRRPHEAEAAYRRAIGFQPDLAEAYGGLGNLYMATGRLHAAREQYDAMLRLQPENVAAMNNLAAALRAAGQTPEADEILDRAIAICGDYQVASFNRLLNAHYRQDRDAERIARMHRNWGRERGMIPAERWMRPPELNDPAGDPIRVGFVSADFRDHPVAALLIGLFEAPRRRWRAYCYATSPVCDAMTQRFKAAADGYRPIAQRMTQDAAEIVRADNIDVLIDLAGHTAGARADLFAAKPARRTLCWLGYVWTNGLPNNDGYVTDAVHAPQGEESLFDGDVLRLPTPAMTYAPPKFAPEVSPPPSRDGAPTTFGTFNALPKLSPATFDLLAETLKGSPGSRLFLKTSGLDDPPVVARVHRAFESRGVAADRIDLEGRGTRSEILAAYARMDIALDPLPYSGGVTSLEALWMGVPIVTWPQDRPASRHAAAFLTALDLEELIAGDAEDYVSIAAGLAADGGHLADLRAGLRDRVRKSRLMDYAAFERAFADMLAKAIA